MNIKGHFTRKIESSFTLNFLWFLIWVLTYFVLDDVVSLRSNIIMTGFCLFQISYIRNFISLNFKSRCWGLELLHPQSDEHKCWATETFSPEKHSNFWKPSKTNPIYRITLSLHKQIFFHLNKLHFMTFSLFLPRELHLASTIITP